MIKICAILMLIACTPGRCVTIGTFNLPPFSMSEENERIGLVTVALQRLMQKAEVSQYKFIDYPLARGLAELQAGRIDIFYPYVQDEDAQEQQRYILIGPIARYSVALFVRKDYAYPISLEGAEHLILGAERGSIEDKLIRNYALHIDQATQAISCLRMVLAQRISACAIGTLPGQYVAAINNLSSQLRFQKTGSYADMYVALKHDFDPDMAAKIQRAYLTLKQENYFVKQQNDYEAKFEIFIKTLS